MLHLKDKNKDTFMNDVTLEIAIMREVKKNTFLVRSYYFLVGIIIGSVVSSIIVANTILDHVL
jgi:hypothetical protein